MKMLSRWLMKRLSQGTGRYLQFHGLLQVNKCNPALLWQPEGKKIVVLAPHMDDEVIGCGGTLYKHIQRGATVTVIYLTDGRYGGKRPPPPAGGRTGRHGTSLVELRKHEALLAMETLGIQDGILLDVEDGQLSSAHGLPGRVKEILESIRPDLVYLPFFLEEHPDHRAVSHILLGATEEMSCEFDCCGYEVWTPLFPNCLVDITDAVAIKTQALRQYQSQLLENDYLHASLGLNAYRSMALSEQRGGYVEAFFSASLRDYRELYRGYGGAVLEAHKA